MNYLPYFGGAFVCAALLAVSHWFPWPRKLHRLEAYTMGLGAYLAGAGVWLGLTGHIDVWIGLLGLAMVAGGMTLIVWAIDKLLNGKTQAQIDERLDKYVKRTDRPD